MSIRLYGERWAEGRRTPMGNDLEIEIRAGAHLDLRGRGLFGPATGTMQLYADAIL